MIWNGCYAIRERNTQWWTRVADSTKSFARGSLRSLARSARLKSFEKIGDTASNGQTKQNTLKIHGNKGTYALNPWKMQQNLRKILPKYPKEPKRSPKDTTRGRRERQGCHQGAKLTTNGPQREPKGRQRVTKMVPKSSQNAYHGPAGKNLQN